MAGFNVTTQLFTYMDTVVSQFVAANLSNVITAVAPVVALGLTMQLMIEGLFLMGRPGSEPLSSLVNRFVKYALVISVASTGGWYQTTLANLALKTPDEFAQIFIINGQNGKAAQGSMSSTIDAAMQDGLTIAKTAFEHAGVFTGPAIASGFLAITVLIVTAVFCGIGAGLILMAKVLLGVVVCFGPLFVFLLLFESTAALFSKWIGSVINYGLVTVLLSSVFGLLMFFFKSAIASAATPNPSTPVLVAIVTCILLLVVSYFVLKEVPHLAASWGQGVAADIFKHMRQNKTGGGSQSSSAGGGGGQKADPGAGSSSGSSAGPQEASNSASAAAKTTPARMRARAATNGFAKGSRR